MGYKNMTIINDQNPKKNSVKEIYPTTYYSYYIVHLSKNLVRYVRQGGCKTI